MMKTSESHISLRNEGERILAQGVCVSNDTFKTQHNNNDLIIGPTGSGKTRYYVKPNLLNASENLVVTDTKGSLYREMGPALRDAGYKVLLLDMTDPAHSIGYDPLDYVRYDEERDEYNQEDIATLANNLYGLEKTCSREPYWDEAGKGLYKSLLSGVLEMTVKEDHTIRSVRKLFELVKANGKRGSKSEYMRLMERLQERDPDSFAAAQYMSVISEDVETTANCIRMMVGNKLAQLASREVEMLLCRDERIDILQLAREKTALFVTISDMDRSQDMLANLFYTQALQTLCHYADKECEDHCLPIPVRFILDDFATNARIPDFDKMISVIRSRGIAVSIILQSQAQLEQMYGPDAATTILNGCDTVLYLGGQDLSTARYIGTRVNKSDFTVLTMPLDQAWLLQRGCKPKLVKRYDLTSHPRYHLLPEAKKAAKKTVKKAAKPSKRSVTTKAKDPKEVA